jgi:predicted metal-dependent hydrolase
MPYIEPYFTKTVRSALPFLDDELRPTAEHFAAQEAQHQAEHRRFNAAVRAHAPRIARLERTMRRVYRWLWGTRSLEFNLAFTAASETIAYALARWMSDHLQLFTGGSDPTIGRMFIWHLAEEVEHKSVGYDVFEAVDGSRWRYLRAALLSISLVGIFVTTGTLIQLASQRRLRNPLTWFRLAGWAISTGMEVLPTLALSALPSHHPSKLVDPSWFGLWLTDMEMTAGGDNVDQANARPGAA